MADDVGWDEECSLCRERNMLNMRTSSPGDARTVRTMSHPLLPEGLEFGAFAASAADAIWSHHVCETRSAHELTEW